MKFTLVVPAFNEASVLAHTIPELHKTVASLPGTNTQIVIANNASTDATEKVVEKLKQSFENIRYIYIPEQGRGAALKIAWQTFPADIYGYIDADLDINPEIIIPALEGIKTSDLLIGSKLHLQSKIVRQWHRKIISSLGSKIVRTVLHLKTSDTQCGFKLLRHGTLTKLLPMTRESGWFFDTELVLLATRYGFTITEIPVEVTTNRFQNRGSTFKPFSSALPFIRFLWNHRNKNT